MSEPRWLKFLGGNRGRSSRTLSSPRSEPALRLLHQNSQFTEEIPSHHRSPVCRLSSWHNPVRAEIMLLDSGKGREQGLPAGGKETIWHNPSIDQVAEALRVFMMTKPLLEPLPPNYNSHILHLIEAYAMMKLKLQASDKEMAETRTQLRQEQDAFSSKEETWAIQEARYKAEIKRLEIHIHHTSEGGLGAVALARAGSLIRGNVRNQANFKESSDVEEDDIDNTSIHSLSIGYQSSHLHRPRIIDTSNDIRLSRRLRQDASRNTATLGQTHTLGRRDSTMAQQELILDVSKSGSDSCGAAAVGTLPDEDKRNQERDSLSRHRNSTGPSFNLVMGKSRTDKKSRVQHRRDFSFVPGDEDLARGKASQE